MLFKTIGVFLWAISLLGLESEKNEKKLECCICLYEKIPNDFIRLQNCGHLVCKICLEYYEIDKIIRCPICRTPDEIKDSILWCNFLQSYDHVFDRHSLDYEFTREFNDYPKEQIEEPEEEDDFDIFGCCYLLNLLKFCCCTSREPPPVTIRLHENEFTHEEYRRIVKYMYNDDSLEQLQDSNIATRNPQVVAQEVLSLEQNFLELSVDAVQ